MTAAMRQELDRRTLLANLARRARSGINTFYWIAGMSAINSVVAVVGSNWRFSIGLAATLVVDAFAQAFIQRLPDLALFLRVLQFCIDIGIVLLFVLFGYLGLKNKRWAIITGMVLYALDAVLMLVFFQDILAAGIHVLFLWFLWGGLQALSQFNRLVAAQTAPATPPIPQTPFGG
jgi:hypothetical protein